MRRTLTILAAMTLTACAPEPDMAMQSRITVERIGIFADDLAYNERRGVYVIRDKETGREFIGLSGVGIAEVGSHKSGKVIAGDER